MVQLQYFFFTVAVGTCVFDVLYFILKPGKCKTFVNWSSFPPSTGNHRVHAVLSVGARFYMSKEKVQGCWDAEANRKMTNVGWLLSLILNISTTNSNVSEIIYTFVHRRLQQP